MSKYPAPDIPAELEPYVRAMGRQLAVRFFLTFGGAPIYISENPTSKSSICELIGERALRELFEHFDATPAGTKNVRVPVNRRWIAKQLRSDGEAVVQIARTLHVSDVMVRRYLSEGDRAARADAYRRRQLQLL